MLEVLESTRKIIEEDTSKQIFADVKMEIELNGYTDHTLSFPESVEPNMFTPESVMLPRRPAGGLPKMLAGSGRTLSTSVEALVYSKDKIWYRTPTKDSKYKYFRTKSVSGAGDGEDGFSFENPQEFTVEYSETIRPNHIVIGFEYANSLPVDVNVELYIDEEWVEIGQYTPSDKGLIEIYYDGSWIEGRETSEDFVGFSKIRITVDRMDSPGSAVELIQISPRLFLDITNRIIDATLAYSRESVELGSPMGVSSANVAALEIENTDGFFDNENQDSPLAGLIDVNVKFIVEALVGQGDDFEKIPQMIVYVNSWQYQSEGRISAESSDFSKILQTQRLDNAFYQNKDIRFVVVDILERAGVVDYEVRYSELDSFNRIPYIYFDSDSTVWQVLQQIAVAEQAIFYFDESGTFVWESRDYSWEDSAADTVLSGRARGDILPNLSSYSYSHQTVANVARVYYVPTDLLRYGEELNTNFLWELDEETALVATPVLGDIDDDSQFIVINQDDYELFPEEGIVNIDAEFIKFSKSRSEDLNGAVEIDGEEPENVLYITERGLFNSKKVKHFTELDEDYWKFETYWPGVSEDFFGEEEFVYLNPTFESEGPGGFSYIEKSKLIIDSTRRDRRSYAQFVSVSEQESFDVYGTQIRFPMSETENFEPTYNGDGIAGIVFNAKSDEVYPYQGYYVELVSSQYAKSSDENKREVRILKISEQLSDPVLLAGYFDADTDLDINQVEEIFGAELLVFPGADYKLEVILEKNIVIVDGQEKNSLTINALVNGRRILSYTDLESDDNQVYMDGSWGVYARSNTEVQFEYVYAIDRLGDNTKVLGSQTAIRDRVRGGFIDNTLESFITEFNSLRNEFIFEDFGAWAREVKEFDVKHDIFPAISTNLFISNDNDTYLVYYQRDQFSSKFAIGNRTRDFVFLSGDDPRTQTRMTVAAYGVPIEEKEQNENEKRDEASILRRGELDVLVDSRWIQTKAQSNRIAEWIVSRWGTPVEFVTVDSVLDPRIQLGDIVSIDVPENNLYKETNKFRVINIQKTIGSQHSLSLTLRRFRL